MIPRRDDGSVIGWVHHAWRLLQAELGDDCPPYAWVEDRVRTWNADVICPHEKGGYDATKAVPHLLVFYANRIGLTDQLTLTCPACKSEARAWRYGDPRPPWWYIVSHVLADGEWCEGGGKPAVEQPDPKTATVATPVAPPKPEQLALL